MPIVCLHHPERHAATSCSHCSKPLCSECIIRHGRDVFCSAECRHAALASHKGGAMQEVGGIVHLTPLRLGLCALVVVGCALVVAALLL